MDDYFKNKMIELSKSLDIELDDIQINKFYEYMNLLLEWNEKINLTAIAEKEDIILKHFIDSITIFKYLKDNDKIIDVGTGAGFPGIPISILNDNIKITLLDSLNKRVMFLNEVIEKLKLKNIEAIHSRAEELGHNRIHREQYDVVVSRAVANMTTLTEYLLPFVKINGRCICMKGPDYEEELKDAEFAINELGGKIERIEKIILPNSDIERNLIIIKKINQTKNKYPRKAGTPSKEPLKNCR